MKFLYNNRKLIYFDYSIDQMFELELPNGSIPVSLSGGLDSTVLLYVICQYIQDLNLQNEIKIIPTHSVNEAANNSLAITQELVEQCEKYFPEVIFDDMEVGFYYKGSYAKGLHPKEPCHDKLYKSIFDRDSSVKLVIDALTGLPEKSILESWGVFYDENRANKKNNMYYYRSNNILNYRPFVEIDKKMVASLFYHLKMPEDIISKSWSCNKGPLDTKNFTEPCKKCYHCWEKKWAFGQF